MRKSLVAILVIIIVALVATVAFLGKTLTSKNAEIAGLNEQVSSLNSKVSELIPHSAWDVDGNILYVGFDTPYFYSIEDAVASRNKVGTISDETSMSSLTGNRALIAFDSQTKLVAVKYTATNVNTPFNGKSRTVYALPGGMYVVAPSIEG